MLLNVLMFLISVDKPYLRVGSNLCWCLGWGKHVPQTMRIAQSWPQCFCPSIYLDKNAMYYKVLNQVSDLGSDSTNHMKKMLWLELVSEE